MTMMPRFYAALASLIGGAMLATGAVPASATALAPATVYTGEDASIQQVRHTWEHRPGRLQGERYWQQKNAPRYSGSGYRFQAPTFGFGLNVPSGPTAGYGLSVPRDQRFGTDAPAIDPRYGRIDR